MEVELKAPQPTSGRGRTQGHSTVPFHVASSCDEMRPHEMGSESGSWDPSPPFWRPRAQPVTTDCPMSPTCKWRFPGSSPWVSSNPAPGDLEPTSACMTAEVCESVWKRLRIADSSAHVCVGRQACTRAHMCISAGLKGWTTTTAWHWTNQIFPQEVHLHAGHGRNPSQLRIMRAPLMRGHDWPERLSVPTLDGRCPNIGVVDPLRGALDFCDGKPEWGELRSGGLTIKCCPCG